MALSVELNWIQEVANLKGNYSHSIRWLQNAEQKLIGIYEDWAKNETYLAHLSELDGTYLGNEKLSDVSAGSADLHNFPEGSIALTFVNHDTDYHANFGFIESDLSYQVTDRLDIINYSYISLAKSNNANTSIMGVMEPHTDWILNLIEIDENGSFSTAVSHKVESSRSYEDLISLEDGTLLYSGWYSTWEAGAETFLQLVDSSNYTITDEILAHIWRAGSQWYVDAIDVGENEFIMFYNNDNEVLKASKFDYQGELLNADVPLIDLHYMGSEGAAILAWGDGFLLAGWDGYSDIAINQFDREFNLVNTVSIAPPSGVSKYGIDSIDLTQLTDDDLLLSWSMRSDAIDPVTGLNPISATIYTASVAIESKSNVSYIAEDNSFVKRITLEGSGDITGVGNSLNNVISGNSANNVLNGNGGNDILLGGAGNDKIIGGEGNDTIILEGCGTFGSGFVALNISSALQAGTEERINLNGKTRFQDVMDGGTDADTVELTDASDAFFLHDSFSGFHSSLTLSIDHEGRAGTARIENIENINAGNGDDIVDLTSPDYSLAGQNITVNGGEGHDTLWGSDADEVLKGEDGDDILFGGAGTNTLTGGLGADEFQFTKTSTTDTIKDFNITEGDTLAFFNTSGAAFDTSSMVLTEESLQINYSAEDSITILLEGSNLTVEDLSDSIFVV